MIFVFFATMFLWFLASVTYLSNANFYDRLPSTIMSICVMIHTPLSVGFHLFGCMNHEVFSKWRSYDFAGMLFLGPAVCWAFNYYPLHRLPKVMLSLLLILTPCCWFLAWTLLVPSRNSELSREQRFMLIGVASLFGLIPMMLTSCCSALSVMRQEVPDPINTQLLLSAVGLISTMLTGGACYLFQFPERYFPTKDFSLSLFHSHSLLHVGYFITSLNLWWAFYAGYQRLNYRDPFAAGVCQDIF